MRGTYKIHVGRESSCFEIDVKLEGFHVLLAEKGFPVNAALEDLVIGDHPNKIIRVSEKFPGLFGAFHVLHILVILIKHFNFMALNFSSRGTPISKP